VRVFLKKREVVRLIEALYNIEDTCGPLEPREKAQDQAIVDKLNRYASPIVRKKRRPRPVQAEIIL